MPPIPRHPAWPWPLQPLPAHYSKAGLRWAVVDDGLVFWMDVPWRAAPHCPLHWVGALERSPIITGAAWEIIEIMLRKGQPKNVPGLVKPQLVADEMSESYSLLWDHLTQDTWDDGTKRETSTLLIFYQDGFLKGMVKDPNEKACMWAAGLSLSELLATLEEKLGDPAAEWRADRGAGNGHAKRLKK